jgi:hypothetical protein
MVNLIISRGTLTSPPLARGLASLPPAARHMRLDCGPRPLGSLRLPHREPPRLDYFGETFRDVPPRLRFSPRRSGAPGRRERSAESRHSLWHTASGLRLSASGSRPGSPPAYPLPPTGSGLLPPSHNSVVNRER